MKIRTRNHKDFYSGLIFIFFGLFAVLVAQDYPMGSALRMGPGYFPIILGSVLAVLGLIVSLRSLCLSGEAIQAWAARPLIFVLGSALAFAFLIRPLGLALTTLTLVIISSLGGREFCPREVAILSLILAALAVGLFIYGLGLPFSVWLQ